MNIRRLQGIALILSALCLVLGNLLPESAVTPILAVIGIVLLILGIPGVQAAQPEGAFGWIGILLIEIAALIALAFRLDLLAGSGLALASAILGMLGRVIIGWLTVRGDRFPAWVGWAFILGSLINLFGGLVDLGGAARMVSIIGMLLEAAALIGYGIGLIR